MIVCHKVSSHQAGMRLDLVLKKLGNSSRQNIQKAIKNGLCRINGKIELHPDKKLLPGEELQAELPEQSSDLQAEKDCTQILWEDEYLAVCNKPAGLTVHPCPSSPENTLVQQLLSRYPGLRKQGGWRPGIVHRLDKDTSGLLLIALEESARLALSEIFSRHEIFKDYLCLVKGQPPSEGEIDKPIGRHPLHRTKMAVVEENKGGKQAKTSWRRLAYFAKGDFSILRVRIYTGRTHQIRVHMADLGYPLFGDTVYAPGAIAAMAPRQMLHAARLSFKHPFSARQMNFFAPPPEDFMQTIIENAKQPLLIIVTGKPGSGKSAFCEFLSAHALPYISADSIIESLYAPKTALTDWIAINMPPDALSEKGNANKKNLFEILERNIRLKQEFEAYAHQLVFDEIKNFWNDIHNRESPAIIAEIPLYLECGWQKRFDGDVLVIGVHCNDTLRAKRLRLNRNWDDKKIAAIDSWQWTEERKMAACQIVIDNQDGKDKLKSQADHVLDFIKNEISRKNDCLKKYINNLWNNEFNKALS